MAHEGNEDILRRLKSVEGHVRGIQRMIEEDAYCIDVVNQIVAIQRALKKVSVLVLDQHLHSCVTEAVRGQDVADRERVLTELMQVFEASGRS
jgi:CsoR family transcriptional regulator, copper-sensing transcriptional repressor